MLNRRRILLTATLAPIVAACGSTPEDKPADKASLSPAASQDAPKDAGSSAAPKNTGDLTVYAPGALAAHVKPLAAAYEKAGLGKVTFEVGHTPIQREQLAKGATPDVWIAASKKDVDAAAEKGSITKDAIKPVANTRLGIVVAPGNPGKVEKIEDLAKPGLKLLLATEQLPIWMATAKTLDKVEKKNAGFKDKVIKNAVSREMGVKPIVQKVELGVGQAGIVFVTDVPGTSKATLVEIADDVTSQLMMFAAPVEKGQNQEGATAFIEFLTTGDGAKVLADAGYTKPRAE